MNVAVIGAGFWGSAIALRLSELGCRINIFDDQRSTGASRAAAGICKLGWYRQDTVRKMMAGTFTYADFAAGFEWLCDRVPVRKVDERFINSMRGSETVHHDNYLADPADLLVSLSHKATVKLIAEHPGGVTVLTDTDSYEADAVIVAAGASTDSFLAASGLPPVTGVRGLWGRAMLFDAADPGVECRTIMTRPYQHFTFRHFRGRLRGGDTVERGARDDAHLDRLFSLAVDTFGPIRNVEVIGGVRPVCPQMYVGPVPGHPRILAATGGHRVGFGLAGAVAHRIAEHLELQ